MSEIKPLDIEFYDRFPSPTLGTPDAADLLPDLKPLLEQYDALRSRFEELEAAFEEKRMAPVAYASAVEQAVREGKKAPAAPQREVLLAEANILKEQAKALRDEARKVVAEISRVVRQGRPVILQALASRVAERQEALEAAWQAFNAALAERDAAIAARDGYLAFVAEDRSNGPAWTQYAKRILSWERQDRRDKNRVPWGVLRMANQRRKLDIDEIDMIVRAPDPAVFADDPFADPENAEALANIAKVYRQRKGGRE